MPRGGRPHASWLRQVEPYLKDAGMAAWRLPGLWPDKGRGSTVARWTRRRAAPANAATPDLIYSISFTSSQCVSAKTHHTTTIDGPVFFCNWAKFAIIKN